MSKDIEEFKIKSRSVLGVFGYEEGHTGFKIPIYQRPYNWAETHINRLVEDIMEDIYNLVPDDLRDKSDIHSYTFLGEVLITPESVNDSFTGKSFFIVDGQQRMTTLSLLACALIEWLLINKAKITDRAKSDLQSSELKAFNQVYERLLNNVSISLLGFCSGKIDGIGNDIRFPRIVSAIGGGQKSDYRASTPSNSEYVSDIAFFLDEFYKYFEQNKDEARVEKFNQNVKEWENVRYCQNFEHFRKIIPQLSNNKYETEEKQLMSILKEDNFNNKNIKKILELSNLEDIFKDLIQKENKHDSNNFYAECLFPYLRICLFAKYVANNVAMATVECPDEHYAFSIFEKINTSGEPLTALETFKPDIIKVKDSYTNSGTADDKNKALDIYDTFCNVERYVDNFSLNSNSEISLTKRKNISADVVLAFNQYYNKKESSRKLNAQRNIMKKFTSEDINGKVNFTHCLKDICDYREKFWDNPSNIIDISSDPIDEDARIAKVCFLYFKDMKKRLSIPILTGALARSNYNANDKDFLTSVKALTAFTILWRAYTGGTEGINKKYYKMIGIDSSTLKDRLCTTLKEKINNIQDDKELRDFWIRNVMKSRLYEYGNRSTAKFILLCAKDVEEKSKSRESRHADKFLTHSTWHCDMYNTIEHIAPQNPIDGDDDSKAIIGDSLLHTIGNLILLPTEVNSALSNLKWKEKREIYTLLSTADKAEIQNYLKQHQDLIDKFPKTIANIDNQPRLQMFEDIVNEQNWTTESVIKRSEDILTFAFDELFSWLK